MSAADPRYYQLWAARASAPSAVSSTGIDKSYRVDLDAPGGVTYAPSELANHNAKRRLFIPRKGTSDVEYDYGYEIAQRTHQRQSVGALVPEDAAPSGSLFGIGDDTVTEAIEDGEDEHLPAYDPIKSTEKDQTAEPQSAAQLYARSVATQARSEDPAEATFANASKTREADPVQSASQVSASVAPSDARSYRSTTTAADVARRLGVFQTPAMLKDDAAVVSTFRPPPSVSGDSHSVDPWNVTALHSRREMERLTEEEKAKGLTRFEEYSGVGNAPSMDEVKANAERDGGLFTDTATLRTAKTAMTSRTAMGGVGSLRVRDLFIPDPRPYRPLRLVRRTDPRQALILASGVALSVQEQKQIRAITAAAASGITKDMWKEEQAKALLASMGGDDASDLRGGLGLYYCPSDPTVLPTEISPRADTNFSKRMERVTFPHQTTGRRAALRAVVAALEYIKWEEEGFDKVVVGVSEEWILRGITNDIHEWRNNGWRLSRQTLLGLPGDTVPDQDLWELLDQIVSDWEKIDCSIRFWHLSREEMGPATELAEAGALKDDQQPHIVKWTKKTRRFD